MAFVDARGARIYYECHGEGPALVFAHGRGGNAASWCQQVPRFVRDYRVLVFDHRGFGRSRCEPGAEFVQLPTAGHSPYFETPDAFNDAVAGFLARHVGA